MYERTNVKTITNNQRTYPKVEIDHPRVHVSQWRQAQISWTVQNPDDD